MSTPKKQAPKADHDVDDDAVADGDDNSHDEAAEILTDLVQNQMSMGSSSARAADNTQIVEAQTTALQQLLQQGGASAAGSSQQSTMQSILDAAMKGNVAAQQQLMSQAAETGEKKHLFWDTQVSTQTYMLITIECLQLYTSHTCV